jgi:hypothetical protein
MAVLGNRGQDRLIKGLSLIISLGGKNEKGFVGFIGWPVIR